jgi:hypothetical protein
MMTAPPTSSNTAPKLEALSTLSTPDNEISSSNSNGDWIAGSLLTAKAAATIGKCLPQPAGGIIEGISLAVVTCLELLDASLISFWIILIGLMIAVE